jgi:hypothetical protein
VIVGIEAFSLNVTRSSRVRNSSTIDVKHETLPLQVSFVEVMFGDLFHLQVMFWLLLAMLRFTSFLSFFFGFEPRDDIVCVRIWGLGIFIHALSRPCYLMPSI